MSNLTDAELSAILALVAIISAAIGFLIKRRVTDAKAQERATLLNSLADLRAKLGGDGGGLREVAALETFIRGGGIVSEPTAQALGVTADLDDDNMPGEYWTWPAVSARTHAR